MVSPTPYEISVPQEKVDGLKYKLSKATFPDQLEASAWDLGAPLADMRRLTKAWEQWDWRQAEAKLNQLPQFTTDVEVSSFGKVNVHFVHQRSDVTEAIPLLFVHGWPGSFIEVVKLLPLLADTRNGTPAFHNIAPSLPNYGFSQGISKRGFAAAQYAETCHKLMLQLGYDKYVTQGGDWGFLVTRAMGAIYPESCMASHVNMIPANAPVFKKNPVLALQHSVHSYTEKEKLGFGRTGWLQHTPIHQASDLGICSPRLARCSAAWIYEKLHDWTDNYPWTDDEILTWVSIFQFSRAGPGAAHRIYYEVQHTAGSAKGEGIHGKTFSMGDSMGYIPHVKLGVTLNPKEIIVLPKLWARTMGNVVYEAENDIGGHFYAHEHPEWLARDLQTMFGKGGRAYGVVKGKSGYD